MGGDGATNAFWDRSFPSSEGSKPQEKKIVRVVSQDSGISPTPPMSMHLEAQANKPKKDRKRKQAASADEMPNTSRQKSGGNIPALYVPRPGPAATSAPQREYAGYPSSTIPPPQLFQMQMTVPVPIGSLTDMPTDPMSGGTFANYPYSMAGWYMPAPGSASTLPAQNATQYGPRHVFLHSTANPPIAPQKTSTEQEFAPEPPRQDEVRNTLWAVHSMYNST